MKKLTLKQLLMLTIVALMAPTIRRLPFWTISRAGNAAWLGPLAAIVPLVLLSLMVGEMLYKTEGHGYCDVLLRVLGKYAGGAVALLYFGWLLLTTSVLTRNYAERFLSTVYRGEPIQLFIILLLVLAAWVGRQPFIQLARAGQIYFWIFVAVLLLVFGLGGKDVSVKNLLPVTFGDTLPVLKASLGVIGAGAGGLYLTFLAREVELTPKTGRTAAKWFLAYGLICAVMIAIIVGVFGADVAERLHMAFFMLVKNVEVPGVLERAESIIIAFWVVTDFLLVTLQLICAKNILERLFRLKKPEATVAPMAMTVFTLSIILAPDSFALDKFSEKFVQPVNIVFAAVVPAVVWVVFKLRRLGRPEPPPQA